MNGYQLLNQVGAGGTLSSLFTILSLFTENVKISWQDGDRIDDHMDPSVASPASYESPRARSNSDIPELDLAALNSPGLRHRSASVSSSGSTVHAAGITSPRDTPINQERLFLRTSSGTAPASVRGSNSASTVTETQSHYGVVARAAEDSTLAVIPAEAFQRLTKKFPKAAAHIVQGEWLLIMVSTCSLISYYSSNPHSLLACHLQRSTQLSWPDD